MGDVDHGAATPEAPSWLVLPQDVDLTSCDREAIHLPGAIQPHGSLVVLDPSDATVVGTSTNAPDVLGLDVAGHEDLLGRSLHDLVAPASVDQVGALVALDSLRTSTVRGAAVGGRPGTWLVHRSDRFAVLEFEPGTGDDDDLEQLLARVTEASSDVAVAADLAEAERATARHVQELLGVDRAMVYRFHEDGHGEVVAEEVVRGEPFLGLHYPATDIPRQARALYVRNWTRLIADVHAVDVPLVADGGARLTSLDLAGAQLRAVSPIHLEYLRNMGVRASMSLSLVVGGELVGLVACHHGAPLRLAYGRRLCAELLARTLSEQLARVAARDAALSRERQRAAQLRLLTSIASAGGGGSALSATATDQRELLGAQAFLAARASTDAGVHDGALALDVAEGEQAPPVAVLRRAAVRLLEGGDGPTSTDDLQAVVDGTDGGMLVARAGEVVLAWWRVASTTTVTWAGEPHKPLGDDGLLTPRASFAAWQETVAGRSAPWSTPDHDVAAAVVGAVRSAMAPDQDAAGGDANRVMAAMVEMNADLRASHRLQARAIEDLEDMLALVAHDVRGMLSSIGGHSDVVARLVDPDGADARLANSLGAISRGVKGIGRLLEDANRWAHAGSRAATVGTTSVTDMGTAAETALAAVADRLERASAVVEVGPLPSVKGDPGLMREVLQNLVENSCKYKHPDRPLRLQITEVLPRPVDGVVVAVTDNGIGIDHDDQERVMRAFQQLDRHAEGTGLGLALVRKVVEAQGGTVALTSDAGSGTTVSLHLRQDAG